MLRQLVGLVIGLCLLTVASSVRAQCTMDTDCKGDRVCEAGACVSPPPAAPPAQAAPPPAAPQPPPAAQPVPSSDPKVLPEPRPLPDPLPDPPRRRRYSTGMMAGGIVMVSFAPIALLVAAVASSQQSSCEDDVNYRRGYDENGVYTKVPIPPVGCDDYDPTIYGGLVSAAVLGGVGVPLIIIGGKKQPTTARVTPWATPNAAGLAMRVDL